MFTNSIIKQKKYDENYRRVLKRLITNFDVIHCDETAKNFLNQKLRDYEVKILTEKGYI